MPRALLVVDVQPTFCEEGALGVQGGNDVAEKIAEYVATHRHDYALIATSQDWHIDPGDHFSDEPDFVDTWPPHGIAGTAEAELHPALTDLNADIAVKKGQYAAAYSAFEGTTDDGTLLSKALKDTGIDAIDIVGIAESHCVCASALDAVAAGFSVRVLRDLTVPVSEEQGAAAREKMAAAGAELIDAERA